MKTFEKIISESKLIYKSQKADTALKTWSIKKTRCEVLVYEDVPCSDIDVIVCTTLYFNDGKLHKEELATILGFNVRDDFESSPKRYKDNAEIGIFNELINNVVKDELIIKQDDYIILSSLGEFSIRSLKKRLFYKAECRFYENFKLKSIDGVSFPFRDALGITTTISNKTKLSFYKDLSKYDIDPQIDENKKVLVESLLLQTDVGINIFSAKLNKRDFIIESEGFNVSIHNDNNIDYALIYSKKGSVSEFASRLINDENNKKILNIKIEWGYYLRLLNDPDASLDYDSLKPFEDIIQWGKVIKDSRFCWNDHALFKMLKENIDANLWNEVSALCPIKDIKNYINEYSEFWDWDILSARIDTQFIVNNASSFPWNYDIVILNDQIKTEEIEQLLLDPNLTSVQWLWKDIMPSLSNEFVIKNIDYVSFDLSILTEKYPDITKSLILEYPDKSWNWNYISNTYDLNYILNNITLLINRIDIGKVIIRAFQSKEYSTLYCSSTVLRQSLAGVTESKSLYYNFNSEDLIWSDEIIIFLEQIGFITWCNPIIGGFERNSYINWSKEFFSKYSNRIINPAGYTSVTKRVDDYTTVDDNPDFPWNWEIISSKSEWILNTGFVSRHLDQLNLSKSFGLFSSETFCAIFANPIIQDYLSNYPENWTKATELASIQLVKDHIDCNWDWNLLTKKTVNSLKLEKLDDARWADKWNWNYLSEELNIEQLSEFLDRYQDYWNWSILTRRLERSIIIENLTDFADKWDWDILIDSVFTKEDLNIKGILPMIATIISLREEESQKSLWNKITRRFSIEELIKEVNQSLLVKNYSSLFKWDISYIYDHKDFNIKEYIENYPEDVEWNLLSKSKSAERLFYYDSSILSFKMWLKMVNDLLNRDDYYWDFETLSQNVSINWHPALLKIKKKKWDWKYLSEYSKCFSDSSGAKNKNNLCRNIKQFKDVLDFELLSKRKDITFSDSLLNTFISENWNWKDISASSKLSVSNDFIINHQNKEWDWAVLSQSKRLDIDKDLLRETKQKEWDWTLLSVNKSLKITLSDLLSLGISKWDWASLSGRNDIRFDNDSLLKTIDNSQITWDWKQLSERNDLIFNEDLLLKIYQKPLDWNFVSRNNTFIPSINVLSKISTKDLDWDAISKNQSLEKDALWPYREKLNWHYISQIEKFLKSGNDFYRKYREYLDWSIISGSEFFEISIYNLSEFENELDWTVINSRDDLEYTNEFIDRFSNHINWDKASHSNSIIFSIDFVRKYKDKWNWRELFENPHIKEYSDNYEKAFEDKYNGIRFVDRFTDSEPKVYHFAHLFNAVNIIRSRKILSRLGGKGLFENSAGSNVHRRDTAHHYARFYYRPQTPTQYYNESLGEDSKASKERWIFQGFDYNGRKMWRLYQECPTIKYIGAQRLGSPKCPMPVFFEFDLQEILNSCLDKCYYSTGNMQKDSSCLIPISKNPYRLNTSNLYSTIKNGKDTYKAFSQQEFLVLDELDFSGLHNYRIICFNEDQAEILKQQLGNDPICEHITTDDRTSSGIRIYHRENRTITVSEYDDSIRFSTDYRDPCSIVIECREIDKIEVLEQNNITKVSSGKILAYPSISIKKPEVPIVVRFVDLQKYDSNSWIIYSNEMKQSDSNPKYIIITKQIIERFENEVSKLKIKLDKQLFKDHMLYSYHGIAHTARVMWNAFLIATLDKSFNDTYLQHILYASMIHDLGKRSDTEGEIHGENSANLYKDRINQLYGNQEASIILEAVKYHSIDDSKCPYTIKSNYIWKVLKDADALDRSRLPGRGCNPSFLRNHLFSTDTGKEILSLANDLPSLTEGCSWDSPIEELVEVLHTSLR